MTGVTILDTIEIYTLSGWQFIVGFIPLAVGALITFILFAKKHKMPTALLYEIIGGILSIALLLCLGKICPADYVETRYKVAVDETTSFVEFHDKYNIVEEHPEYFIVTEKSE